MKSTGPETFQRERSEEILSFSYTVPNKKIESLQQQKTEPIKAEVDVGVGLPGFYSHISGPEGRNQAYTSASGVSVTGSSVHTLKTHFQTALLTRPNI